MRSRHDHARRPAGQSRRAPRGRLYAAAARWYDEAFIAQSRLAPDLDAGQRYNAAYALLEKPVPELARINKTDRNQFIWCWQYHEALTEWWKLKAQNQRDRWNHPDAIKRHYLAEHGEGRGPSGTAAKSPSPQQRQRAEV